MVITSVKLYCLVAIDERECPSHGLIQQAHLVRMERRTRWLRVWHPDVYALKPHHCQSGWHYCGGVFPWVLQQCELFWPSYLVDIMTYLSVEVVTLVVDLLHDFFSKRNILFKVAHWKDGYFKLVKMCEWNENDVDCFKCCQVDDEDLQDEPLQIRFWKLGFSMCHMCRKHHKMPLAW